VAVLAHVEVLKQVLFLYLTKEARQISWNERCLSEHDKIGGDVGGMEKEKT
jgi:hypothetical protein